MGVTWNLLQLSVWENTGPEYLVKPYQKDVFGHPMWVHVYRKKEAEKHLERYLREERKNLKRIWMLLFQKGSCVNRIHGHYSRLL